MLLHGHGGGWGILVVVALFAVRILMRRGGWRGPRGPRGPFGM